jgi:uncharacterized protein (DUF885 family)
VIRFGTMALLVLFAAGAIAGAQKSSKKPGEGERLHALLEREWERAMRESPEAASYAGDRRYNDRWTDLSPEAIERRKRHSRALLKELDGFDRAKLTAEDRLNYDLFRNDVELAVAAQQFPVELLPISQMGGVHQEPADVILLQPKQTAADYEKVLARLRAVPVLVEQSTALLRRGLEAGVTFPRVPLRTVGESLAAHVVENPEMSPFWAAAFAEMPQEIAPAEQERIRAEARSIIGGEIRPAFQRLHHFWTAEYYPRTRESVGLSSLPKGEEWYRYSIRRMTTTEMGADEIHQIGLREVQRIRGEMESIRQQVGFKGNLEEFFVFLRTDPQFFFDDPQMLLITYRDIAKRIDPGLTRLFGTLPRLPYGVLPVPEYSEKTQTTAYYTPGSPEAGRPGIFYANLYDLKSRPKWEMEALTVHEAVPGHHLQIALAQELQGVPKFRRHNWGYTAYVEGWGLYSESLGGELGLYKDPYSRFGQLTYEMWRAVRLVVDTGMHSKGWTREQAIDFFRQNSSKSEHDIAVEIDRYIVWPGQALAYKIGELKIRELRAWATTELGEKFDIRSFHDTVLGAGALPLSILESRVKDWVAKQKNAT